MMFRNAKPKLKSERDVHIINNETRFAQLMLNSHLERNKIIDEKNECIKLLFSTHDELKALLNDGGTVEDILIPRLSTETWI